MARGRVAAFFADGQSGSDFCGLIPMDALGGSWQTMARVGSAHRKSRQTAYAAIRSSGDGGCILPIRIVRYVI
jgi:GTP cyclohydrolase III